MYRALRPVTPSELTASSRIILRISLRKPLIPVTVGLDWTGWLDSEVDIENSEPVKNRKGLGARRRLFEKLKS